MLSSCSAERMRAGVLWLFVGLLIAAAVALTGVRLFLVAMPALSDEIEATLSQQLGRPLEIERIDARLSGLRPGLTLTNVQVGADERPIHVDRMIVSLAPWASFRAGAWRLHSLAIQGLRLDLQRSAEGRWSVAGLPQRGFAIRLQTLPVNRLLLTDSQITVYDQKLGIEQVFSNAALRWRQQPDGEWRFALDSRTGSQRLQAVLSINPQQSSGADRAGRALVRFEQLELSPFVPWLDETARVDGRVWLTLGGNGVEAATAEIAGEQLGLLSGGVDTASATARWRRTSKGWQAAIWPERVQGPDGTAHSMGVVALRQDHPTAPLLGRIEHGTLAIFTEAFKRRFEESALLTGALSNLEWAYVDAKAWRVVAEVNAGAVRLDGAEIALDGQVDFASAANANRVDLSASARDVDMATIRRYLPVQIMNEPLSTWLDQALVDGDVNSASLRLAGELHEFPFDHAEGEFTLRLDAEDMTFRFNPDWPTFIGVNPSLVFSGRQLDIEVRDGQIGEVALQSATASIADLWQPQLDVRLALRGGAAAMLDVVKTSPLLPNADWLDQVTLTGEPALDLNLFFPFQRQPLEVDGSLQFAAGGLSLTQPPLQVDRIAGTLTFDRHGLAWERLTGNLGGATITSQATTHAEGGTRAIEIQAQGDLGFEQLPGVAGLAASSQGVAPWQAQWVLPGFTDPPVERSESLRIDLSSTLEGIALELPFGFAKSAAEPIPTRYTWRLQRSGDQLMTLQHEDRLRVIAERKDDGERRAAIHFGSDVDEPLALPEAMGTVISGRLPVVDMTALQKAGQPSNLGTAQGFLPLPLQPSRLTMGGLIVGRWETGAFEVDVQGTASDGFAETQGDLTGSLRYRQLDTGSAVIARLETVKANRRPSFNTVPAQRRETFESMNPMPRIDLTIDDLQIEDAPVGALALTIEPIEAGSQQGQLTLRGATHTVSVALSESPQAASMKSEMEFSLHTEDAGRLLLQSGFGPMLRNGTGSGEGQLSWSGRLWQPDLPSLAGDMAVDLRDGSLPAIEPGAGRAIGLFSVSVLPRRLGLDFSDVVGAGLRFDTLRGRWSLHDGVMRTEQFDLGGPALDLTLAGTNDLVRREYDQQVVVTPRVSSTLALLGGLAGGPAAAALLFLTQGMIEPGIARLTRIEYTIQGPWAAPEFDLINTEGVTESDEQD